MTSKDPSLSACIYILRLRSGSLYVGWTTNLEWRLEEHARGEGGRTTRNDSPDRLVYYESAEDIASAKGREAQLKRWSRAKKEALICGDMESLNALAKRRRFSSPRSTRTDN